MPEFCPWNPHGERRDLILASYPLTSIHVPWPYPYQLYYIALFYWNIVIKIKLSKILMMYMYHKLAFKLNFKCLLLCIFLSGSVWCSPELHHLILNKWAWSWSRTIEFVFHRERHWESVLYPACGSWGIWRFWGRCFINKYGSILMNHLSPGASPALFLMHYLLRGCCKVRGQ